MTTGDTSQLLELITVATTHLELGSVIQNEQIIAALKCTKLPNAIEVHNCATMDAPKLPGIQTLFDGVDGGANAKRLAGGMDLHVVCGGREVVDFTHCLKEDSILRTNNDLLRILPYFRQ